MSLSTLLLASASLLSLVSARTDLTGCTSTDVSSPAGASLAWYVPGTGELCDFLDCGGGMAPPKTDVPGCPLYSGTSTYSPSFMPGWGSATSTPTTIAASSASSWTTAAPTSPTSDAWGSSSWTTDTATSSWDLYTAASSGESTSWGSAASPMISSAASTAWTSAASAATTITSSAALLPSGNVYPSSGMLTSIVTPGSNATLSTVVGSTGGVRSGTAASSGSSSTSTSSPVSSVSVAGAVETARVWLGGAAMVGLGAVVAAL